jgi:Ca2+-binding RTX toxin-like protein
MQRSFDNGRTWPKNQNVVLYDQSMSPEAKRAFFYQPGTPREDYNMFRPESIFFFGEGILPERGDNYLCFAIRSPDKGKTWEKVPTIIRHPKGEMGMLHKDGAGHDFLFGGLGADRIVGSAGNDILVAGQVDCNYTRGALRQISSDWASTRAVDAALEDDVLDETPLVRGFDQLTGSSGADWFIISNDDKITDWKCQNNDRDVRTVL